MTSRAVNASATKMNEGEQIMLEVTPRNDTGRDAMGEFDGMFPTPFALDRLIWFALVAAGLLVAIARCTA